MHERTRGAALRLPRASCAAPEPGHGDVGAADLVLLFLERVVRLAPLVPFVLLRQCAATRAMLPRRGGIDTAAVGCRLPACAVGLRRG